MKFFDIPLEAKPQRFTVDLNGRMVRISLRWKAVHEGGWSLDIADAATEKPLISGLPMVAGCDLLDQYRYLGIKCKLFVEGKNLREATRDNLGGDVKLCIAVDE